MSYELRVMSYELRVTSYELRVTSYELRVRNYELEVYTMNVNEVEIVYYPSVLFVAPKLYGVETLRELLRIGETRRADVMGLRQVIVWFLLKEGLSLKGIAELTGVKRSMLYYYGRVVDDRIYVGDVSTIGVIERINRAKEVWLMERER